jgi:RNA polymerase sigma factor (sigma-70 family)
MIDDKGLVQRILEGDMHAFRLLISQHQRLVAHMIGRLVKNQEEKEGLCQDVFLKVHEKLGEFSFQSRLSTWIATIAYRHAINHLRKKKLLYSDIPAEQDFNALFVEVESPESLMSEKDMDAFVFRLIDELPPQYKSVLTLYHVEDMSYPEICEVMSMPEGTVKNYLFRARKLLKEKVTMYLGKEELL